jgi:hypothetical protein
MTDTPELKTFGNPPIPVEDVVDADGNTYCQVHTDTATGLRCNNCTRLMCAKCAVQTPVGYRCQQCIRERESAFFNADALYYAKLLGVTTVLSALGAFVANLVGFFIFVFFISAAIGGGISEAALRVTRGQRGRYTAELGTVGVVLGAFLLVLLLYLQIPEPVRGFFQFNVPQKITFFQFLMAQWGILLYTVITAVTVYGRLNIYGRRR